MSKHQFTTEQLEEIRDAVKDAEAKSGGEIVPVFINQSDYYEVALWRSGFLFGLLTTIALLVIYYLTDWLTLVPIYFWIVAILAFGLIGAWFCSVSESMKRKFAGKDLINKRVHEKAQHMFVENAVFDTQQRIGIMIFISFFEHQVFIKADDGISAVIPDEEWHKVMGHLIDRLKKGEITRAMVGAIEECGELVAISGIEIEPKDDNELGDELVTPENE